MSKPKILLYGRTGLTGQRIYDLLRDDFKIIAPPHQLLDLTDKRAVVRHIKDVVPDQIIYAAGITKVDDAEKNPKLSFLINSEIPALISKNAAKLNIPVIYISTNGVFDGTLKARPYTEKDSPNPISIYGKSKLEGEKKVLKSFKNNSVVRAVMVYTAQNHSRNDFARLAYKALSENRQLEAISDQIINPIFVDDLVHAIKELMISKSTGIYHVGATNYVSNFQFANRVAKTFGLNKSLIIKKKIDDVFQINQAKRSKYYWLDVTKFQKKFGKGILHTVDESLNLFKKQFLP